MKVAILIIIILAFSTLVLGACAKILYDMLLIKRKQYNNLNRNFLFLEEWMRKNARQPSKVVDSLSNHGCRKVAIYGAGNIGLQLYRELNDSSVEVVGFIDKNRKDTGFIIPTYSLQDVIPEVDAIIIAILYDHEKIERAIREKTDCKILFVEELM